MRFFLILSVLLFTVTPALAAESQVNTKFQSPRSIVMQYECDQINPAEAGFSCQFNADGLVLRLHKQQPNMNSAQRKRADYEFAKLAIRYFELGGTGLHVQADFWPTNQRRVCSHAKNKPFYDYGCSDYTVKD